MTRDQVERLLEQAVLGMEKRFAQQAQQQAQPRGSVELVGRMSNGGAAGGPGSPGQPQLKVVRSLKPLAEGEPLAAVAAPAAAPAAAEGAPEGSAPGAESSQRGGSSMRGGSVRGGAGGSMHRIRSLSAVQQAMSRAYQGGAAGAGQRAAAFGC